jgi:hypothetical protein
MHTRERKEAPHEPNRNGLLSPAPSPPVEERGTTRRASEGSGVQSANGFRGILSQALSSRGGEGIPAAAL